TEGHESAPGSDPLAELARLIGQTDPFADNARRSTRAAASNMADPAPMVPEAPVGDWRRHIERPNYESMPDEPASDQFLSADPQSAYRDDARGDSRHDPDRGYRD